MLHETLGLGSKESSFYHTRDSHSRRCDGVSRTRAASANAGGLMGRAIATLVVMQFTLGATHALSIERIVATAVGHRSERWKRIILRSNLIAYAVAIFLV